MERVNFHLLEKNGKKIGIKRNSIIPNLRRIFIAWKCFLIPQEKYTWVTSEIIQLVM